MKEIYWLTVISNLHCVLIVFFVILIFVGFSSLLSYVLTEIYETKEREVISRFTKKISLAEILPSESADMCFNISQRTNMLSLMTPYCKFKEFFNMGETPDFLIPCWSLAALLDFLSANFYIEIKYLDTQWKLDCRTQVTYARELIDACVEMICKLKEKDLL